MKLFAKCKCHGRRACVWCFLTTISFPLEHLAWERAPFLSGLTKALGL
jgi:hypothetical protein